MLATLNWVINFLLLLELLSSVEQYLIVFLDRSVQQLYNKIKELWWGEQGKNIDEIVVIWAEINYTWTI